MKKMSETMLFLLMIFVGFGFKVFVLPEPISYSSINVNIPTAVSFIAPSPISVDVVGIPDIKVPTLSATEITPVAIRTIFPFRTQSVPGFLNTAMIFLIPSLTPSLYASTMSGEPSSENTPLPTEAVISTPYIIPTPTLSATSTPPILPSPTPTPAPTKEDPTQTPLPNPTSTPTLAPTVPTGDPTSTLDPYPNKTHPNKTKPPHPTQSKKTPRP